MDVVDLLDALQVHAAAAATTAAAAGTGGNFTDVKVGFPAARGRCVRIFYGGEREVEHFEEDKVLNAALIAQAVHVRAYWPLDDAAAKKQRLQEVEMAIFTKDLRTRVLADSQLGGESVDLNMGLAYAEQALLANTKYAVIDIEFVIDYDEFPIAP